MRWRLGERRSNPYSCCFCCHVRLGTVLIGVFSLVSHDIYDTMRYLLIGWPTAVVCYQWLKWSVLFSVHTDGE